MKCLGFNCNNELPLDSVIELCDDCLEEMAEQFYWQRDQETTYRQVGPTVTVRCSGNDNCAICAVIQGVSKNED